MFTVLLFALSSLPVTWLIVCLSFQVLPTSSGLFASVFFLIKVQTCTCFHLSTFIMKDYANNMGTAVFSEIHQAVTEQGFLISLGNLDNQFQQVTGHSSVAALPVPWSQLLIHKKKQKDSALVFLGTQFSSYSPKACRLSLMVWIWVGMVVFVCVLPLQYTGDLLREYPVSLEIDGWINIKLFIEIPGTYKL